MIAYHSFIETLKSILKCCYTDISISGLIVTAPQSLELVNELQSRTPHKDFLKTEQVTDGLQFQLHTNPRTFLIKNEDFKNEDPPLYTLEKGQFVLFFNTSSVIILTEYAHFLYRKALFKLQHRGFDIYPSIRAQFKLICKDSEYFNKIWLHKEAECFALTNGHVEEIQFVSNSLEGLKRANDIIPKKMPQKRKPISIVDFILETSQDDEGIYGKIQLQGNSATVDIEIEAAKTSDLKGKVVPFIQNIIEGFTIEKQETLATLVSEHITEAAYSQVPNGASEDHLLVLQNDLKISKLSFFDDQELLIIYKSKSIFPDNEIIAQLDARLDIVDLSIV